MAGLLTYDYIWLAEAASTAALLACARCCDSSRSCSIRSGSCARCCVSCRSGCIASGCRCARSCCACIRSRYRCRCRCVACCCCVGAACIVFLTASAKRQSQSQRTGYDESLVHDQVPFMVKSKLPRKQPFVCTTATRVLRQPQRKRPVSLLLCILSRLPCAKLYAFSVGPSTT